MENKQTEEIIAGNKLIAEFMELKHVVFDDKNSNAVFEGWVWEEDGKSKQSNKLYYHSSWDWLMPVLEKIEKISKDGKFHQYWNNAESDIRIFHEPIDKTWRIAVQFIKWLNTKTP